MHKPEIENYLRDIREANKVWAEAVKNHRLEIDRLMSRLIHEAAAHRMSVDEVAELSGWTTKHVREKMRLLSLNPRTAKHLLSATAAKALRENAALMGIDPSEIDLTSPLAYLPMGEVLRQELIERGVSQPRTPEWGGAEQLAQKLTDAGLDIDDARAWVAEVSGNRA